MDLADVAAELYALLPGDFTAARNRRAKDAKTEGHPLLAKQVARLPKPTASAWAVNLIARQHPEQLAPVLDLGAALRDAQEMLDAERLRELGQQRSRVLAGAVRGARSAAEGLGVRITDAAATEIEQTLRAAMGDPDAAAAVRSGLLVRAFAGGGFGPADLSGAVAVPGAIADARGQTEDDGEQPSGRAATKAAPAAAAPTKAASTRRAAGKAGAKRAESTRADAEAEEPSAEAERIKAEAAEARRLEAEEAEARREARRQAEEAKRRERDEAQAELGEAEEALAAAETELDDAERQAEEAAGRRASLEGELAELRARVAELEEDLAAAEREEGLAGRARRLAARVAEQERRAVARARERLDRLS